MTDSPKHGQGCACVSDDYKIPDEERPATDNSTNETIDNNYAS
jgi:hypothetical protein